MIIAQIDDCNDCSFAIKFEDESAKETVKEFMKEGLAAWYAATNPEEYEGNSFSKEEVKGFYWEGYTEPTIELLEKKGIESECVDIEYDEHGSINADEVILY